MDMKRTAICLLVLLMILPICLANPGAALKADGDTILLLNYDEKVAADASPTKQKLTETEGQRVKGKYGSAALYGLNWKQHIKATDAPSLSKLSALTVEAWIFHENDGGGRATYVVSKMDPKGGYEFAVQEHGGLFFELTTSEKKIKVLAGKAPDSEWTHVAFCWDGKRIYSFLNGELKGSKPAPGLLDASGGDLIIGRRHKGSNSYVGKLDELRISKVARYTKSFEIKAGE
jgi:Concanavalin A-like lectin/glucanases superfamily